MTRLPRFLLPFCLLLALVLGCGGGDGPKFRPAGSPDILVFSISGQDGVPTPPNCDFDTNREYLGDPGEAVRAIADFFVARNITGNILNYSSRLEIDNDRKGFVELLDQMQFFWESFAKGFVDPTQFIIVAHGHGAVWAHMAASILSHIPIWFMITLDGFCTDWDCLFEDVVDQYQNDLGNPFEWDISRPCARWAVEGEGSLFDTQDVAFDNIFFNLEVFSDGPQADDVENIRLDGTTQGISNFEATGEGHNTIRLGTSDAMMWVLDRIAVLGLNE